MATSNPTIPSIVSALTHRIERAESLLEEATQILKRTTLAHDEYQEYAAQLQMAAYMYSYLKNVLKAITDGTSVDNAMTMLRVHAEQQARQSVGAEDDDLIAFSKGVIGKVLSDISTRLTAA